MFNSKNKIKKDFLWFKVAKSTSHTEHTLSTIFQCVKETLKLSAPQHSGHYVH